LAAVIVIGAALVSGGGPAGATPSPATPIPAPPITAPSITTATGKPKIVEVGLYVGGLYDLNFVSGSYRISFWVWFNYEDKDFHPENSIELIGARDVKIEADDLSRLADGRYHRGIKYMATIGQTWDVKWFPFDRQQIKLMIESARGNSAEVLFIADDHDSKFEPSITVPGWRFQNMAVASTLHHYPTDFGTRNTEQTYYSRLVATITVDRVGDRVFGTAFLGFFAADVLTGVTLLVESFTIMRERIPFVGRLNMVVGALFGAVGNKYITDSSLPPMPEFSFPDVIQISSFSAICFGLIAAIGTETLAGLGVPGPAITAITRSGVGVFVISQLGLAAYFMTTAPRTSESAAH
jgi:hypothetical protein